MTTENQIAFRQFLSREYKRLVNYVYTYLSDKFFSVSAEDIVQDVALNVYSKLDINAPVENLAGYFYRAVRNRIIDYQRKPNPYVSIEDYTDDKDENILLKKIPSDKTEEENNDLELLRTKNLRKAFEKLKPDEKAIIIETEFEGNTFEELSDRWNVPMGTLLSRKHRAMNKLHQMLLEMENQNK